MNTAEIVQRIDRLRDKQADLLQRFQACMDIKALWPTIVFPCSYSVHGPIDGCQLHITDKNKDKRSFPLSSVTPAIASRPQIQKSLDYIRKHSR
ncbi:hypothetical protein KAR91_21240 [Candidatus Pacearchaeota archaeon]|nr:hypothetical protein [Candidatus Pacearchaeota archaeon]